MRAARRTLSTVVVAALAALVAPSAASACSTDDTAYFDGFLDTSCLETPLTQTTIDTFGGLRLDTNGVPVSGIWDTDTEFDNGITWETEMFPPVGERTLATSGAGTGADLILPTAQLPLVPDVANPVLDIPASTVLDSDNVDDPAVAKVGSTYKMWYSGTAENGSGPRIFLAESPDGQVWTRANSGNPVLQGTASNFDARGVFGPDVIYDPTDVAAPYKMWYSGKGDIFGAIGYATSTDGIAWTKYNDPMTAAAVDPVLDHGSSGGPDSFAAADPAVLRDGNTWKMWYTGDDSNKRRIAYATSPDGIDWSKGGKVISPEDPGANANYQFGAYAPTVWKSGGNYNMLLTGRKLVSGVEFQTRVMNASSTDGITWTAPSPTLNPQASRFDASNLNAPDILEDPSTPSPFKLYYAGNAVDANGNFHQRIGYATSTNGSSFTRFNGPMSCLECVLDFGTPGTAFDGREASGLSVVTPAGATPKFAGFYWGNRGSDFKPRLGLATSADGSGWTKVPGPSTGGALLPLSPGMAFDSDGQRDPSVHYEANALGSDDFFLYFTALDPNGDPSIGFSSTEQDGSVQPDNTTWSSPAQVFAPDNSGFDSDAVTHPSLIKDTDYVLYYTGTDNAGNTSIGRSVSMAADGPDGPFGTGAQVTFTGTPACDPDGLKDPVVVKAAAADYRMLYTGLEVLEGKTIERGCYATSTNGTSFARQGVALNPSQMPYSADEVGIEPTGMLIDGATLHAYSSGLDRTGRTRGDHSTTAYPTAAGNLWNGWATYQLGDETTSVRDFRTIERTSTGSTVTLWMSFEQPYSTGGAGNQFWSDFLPVTVANNPETLNFLLTVRGVRWQARLSDPAVNPLLETVEIEHAPVSFFPNGSALTKTIAPPPAVNPFSWNSLTVSTELFVPDDPGTGSGTVSVRDAANTQTLASAPLNTSGDTTINLGGISSATHPSLRVLFDLVSDTPFTATPLVKSLKVLYSAGGGPPLAVVAPALGASCKGRAATVTGTEGNDVLSGTPRPDVIAALGGNDTASGLGGGDIICLGAGKDRGSGGGGNDRIFGEGGPDRLSGGAGRRDLCSGGGTRRDRASRSCEKKKGIP